MTNLVIMKNQQAVTTSLDIAENFDKQHKDVLEAITNKIQSAENSAHYKTMFAEDVYLDSRNRNQKMYYMNRDGFSFIAFGFTGKKADDFKLKYIDAFNQMEKEIKQPKLSLPQNYASALRQLAETVEENESLKIELQQTNFQQEILNDVEKTEIKIETFYTTEEIAESLKLKSARQLNRMLKELRIAYYQKGLWHLYKPYKNKGFKDMSTRRKSQLWTEKGKEFIEIRITKPE